MLWMNPYFYMSLIAFIVKLYIAVSISRHWRPGMNLFAIFLVVSTIHTLTEFMNFTLIHLGRDDFLGIDWARIALNSYYVALLAAMTMMPFVVATIINKKLSRYLTVTAAAMLVAISYFITQTDLIIKGYESILFSYTRVAGDYYWAFQVYALTVCALNVWMMYSVYRHTDRELTRVKCANMLFGFIWVFVVAALVIISMNLGFEVNAVGVLPLAMSIYIVFMFIDIKDNRVYDIRTKLPWTEQYRLLQEVIGPYQYKTDEPIDAKELTKKYNHGLVDIARSMFSTPAKQAKWLGVSRTTVVRRKNDEKE